MMWNMSVNKRFNILPVIFDKYPKMLLFTLFPQYTYKLTKTMSFGYSKSLVITHGDFVWEKSECLLVIHNKCGKISFSGKKSNLELIKTLSCDHSNYLSWCVECFCDQKVEYFTSHFWQISQNATFLHFIPHYPNELNKTCHLATLNNLW